MMYFIDTNMCIYFLKNTYPDMVKRWLSITPDKIKIPSIVKAELLTGAYKSVIKKEILRKLEFFLAPYEIIPFTDEMTLCYAEIRSKLEKSGTVIGPNDLLIASITKHCGGTLITNNTREFKRIPGLKLENWTE